MPVLERSELDASPLADLHAIADQIGLDGFRRLRKAELIDAILERSGGGAPEGVDGDRKEEGAGEERDRPAEGAGEEDRDRSAAPAAAGQRTARRRRPDRKTLGIRRSRASTEDGERDTERAKEEAPAKREGGSEESPAKGRERGSEGAPARGRERAAERDRSGTGGHAEAERPSEDRVASGVVELLGNGSAFLRVSPPEPSEEDLYISAAQVRRCELVSGDRVSGPVRTPRQSERYPSLARVDTINGAPAESVAEGGRYEDLPVAYPSERLELDPQDPTLGAIEWLTPIGRGSRAVIVGGARSGKTETLRRLLAALAGREGLETMLVLSGARPEEIGAWREGPVAPAAALDLAASAELQSQTVEHVVDTAKRVAARGGDVVVLIDGLDGLHPHTARRVLAAARNLAEGGSLTVIATATRPLGGESTVIALDVALTSTGRIPALDLLGSGVVRPELLVGEDGAEAITKARASAVTG
jgi:transcription termination factor Rho